MTRETLEDREAELRDVGMGAAAESVAEELDDVAEPVTSQNIVVREYGSKIYEMDHVSGVGVGFLSQCVAHVFAILATSLRHPNCNRIGTLQRK